RGLRRLRDRARTDGARALDPLSSRTVWFEMVAVAGPTALLALVVASIHTSRLRLWEAPDAADALARAALLGSCFSGQLNAIPLGILLLIPVAGLATVAVSCHASARLQSRGLLTARTLALSDAAGASAWIAHPGPGPGLCLFLAGSFLLAGLGPCVSGPLHFALAPIPTLA